jgi:hypothetical protein
MRRYNRPHKAETFSLAATSTVLADGFLAMNGDVPRLAGRVKAFRFHSAKSIT